MEMAQKVHEVKTDLHTFGIKKHAGEGVNQKLLSKSQTATSEAIEVLR